MLELIVRKKQVDIILGVRLKKSRIMIIPHTFGLIVML